MIAGLADLLVFDFAIAGTAEIIGEIVAPHESMTTLRLLAAGYHYDRGDSPVQSPPNTVATRAEFAALAVAVQLPAVESREVFINTKGGLPAEYR